MNKQTRKENKNMKKILMAALSAILLLSLAACSVPAAPQGSSGALESSAPPASGDSPAEDTGGTSAQTVETLYGKVKSLVGNNLTLDLAKQPEDGGTSTVIPEGAEPDTVGEAAISSSKSVTVTDNGDAGESDGEGGGESDGSVQYFAEDASGNIVQVNPEDMPKLELEYTGEVRELTIPAGLKIYDSIGKELKMSDLKEGNVLMVTQNEDGSIASLIVME